MYSFLTKNGQAIAFVVGVVLAVIFLALVISSPSTEGLDAESFRNLSGAALQERLASLSQFDFGMYATYAMLFIIMGLTVAFGLYHFAGKVASNPKSAIQTLATIAGLVVIFLIAYSTAPSSSSEVAQVEETFEVTSGQSQFISGAINTTLIVGALALVTLIVSEVRNVFK